ncbi:MAG: chloride channel protein [Gemmatimonadaceae bacterium]
MFWERTTGFLRGLVPVSFQGTAEHARERRLLLDTVALGVVGALGAQLFNALLRVSSDLFLGRLAGYHPPGLPNEGGAANEIVGPFGFWLIPVSTTLGGLLVGLLVERFAPEAEGHGTDAVIKAFHRADGELRARVPLVKLLASALTIGSGGVAGREGPMALITGGIGSFYASVTGRRGRDRRLLLLIGMAAGLSAIFRSPIGAALLAVEIPYADMEFEPGALLYTAIGAIVAYAVNGLFVGWEPLFRVSALAGKLPSVLNYGWYVVLGLTAGVVATVLPVVFYRARDFFRRLPLSPYLRPALGGLIAGLIAVAVPKVIGGGYGWIQQAIDGQLALLTLAILIVAKMVAMSATVGSGGSGGVFAPTLFIGAMLGGTCAALFHQPPAPFVVVGMAAVFAGAAHVPIATMMMVTEMTGGYQLLVPATLAVVLSYLLQMRLSSSLQYRSVYEAQVRSLADSPAHHTKHLEIALQILRQKGLHHVADDNELELLSLLRGGIPVELPGERRLVVGVLRQASALVQSTIAESSAVFDPERTKIIGVIRGEHMLGPRPDLVLQTGDRLILVAGAADMDSVWKQLESW